MLIDTHTHLYLAEFADDDPLQITGTPAVRRALDAGVGHMIFPNVDLQTVAPMKALHAAFPRVTSMAMGFRWPRSGASLTAEKNLWPWER